MSTTLKMVVQIVLIDMNFKHNKNRFKNETKLSFDFFLLHGIISLSQTFGGICQNGCKMFSLLEHTFE